MKANNATQATATITTTAAPVAPLDHAAIKASAVDFARSEVLGAEAVKALAKVLGDTPTFTRWDLVFTDWKLAYAGEKGCSAEAAQKAAERMAHRLNVAYGLEKPKAESKAAKAKAEQREGKAAQIDATIKAHGADPAKLQAAAAEALKAGKPDEALSLTTAALKVQKVKQAEATKAAKERLAARWETVMEAIKAAKKSGTDTVLAKIEKALKGK
jgi:hypothetical protein